MDKYFCRSILYKGETDNNDNSTREIQCKQWTFYQRFSELAHFQNEKHLCNLSTGYLKGKVLLHRFYHLPK